MQKFKTMLIAMLAVVAVGCVTINVYFPAAAAEQAAHKFIGDVIGPEVLPAPAASAPPPAPPASVLPPEPPVDSGGGVSAAILNLLIPAAHAAGQQPDLKVSTPAIERLRASMRARYKSGLKDLLNAGAIGFTNDGLVAVRDAADIPLAKRNRVRSLVKAENQDRTEVYKKIAAANGHPEWAHKIQNTFARVWRKMAHAGWYYQDASGAWQQK